MRLLEVFSLLFFSISPILGCPTCGLGNSLCLHIFFYRKITILVVFEEFWHLICLSFSFSNTRFYFSRQSFIFSAHSNSTFVPTPSTSTLTGTKSFMGCCGYRNCS